MGQSLKQILASVGLTPSKRLGQNFLIDENVLAKIVAAAELNKNDVVLEIGPGLGVLTKELASGAGKVVAVEKDKKLAAVLKEKFKDIRNLKIIEEDFLKTNLLKLNLSVGYKIVANLPYSITSAAIRKIMEADPSPSMAVLMVQKEVAERICAKPGEMSLLALSVQYYGTPKLLFKVSKGSFWPVPKVDSAVVKIVFDRNKELGIRNKAEKFFRVARAGFSSPRKQLQNNLANGLHISKEKAALMLRQAGLDPKVRPEELSVEDWLMLVAQTQKL